MEEPRRLQDLLPSRAGHPFLDPILLIQQLGAGGQGSVHLGYHTKLKSWVAVKFCRSTDPESQRRFAAEAQRLAALQSPGFVGVKQVGDKPLPFMVLDFVNGENLRERYGRRRRAGTPMEFAEVVGLIEQSARHLAMAHERGVVHRDIKPDNIMVEADGSVKIADLGIARGGDSVVALTAVPGNAGTRGYMAPEAYVEGAKVTAAADVFSLAVTFAYLLTGRHVLVPAAGVAAIDAARQFPDLRKLGVPMSEELAQLFVDATHQDPKQRIGDARQFLDRLRAACRDLPVVLLRDAGARRFGDDELAQMQRDAEAAMAGPVPVARVVTKSRRERTATPARSNGVLIGGVVVGLIAVVLVALRLSSTESAIRIAVDGADLGAAASVVVDEDVVVRLVATAESGAPCAWEWISGPQLPLGHGGDLRVRMPELVANGVIELRVVPQDQGLPRVLRLQIRADDDPPKLVPVGFDGELGEQDREIRLMATDDGGNPTFSCVSTRDAVVSVRDLGGGRFVLHRVDATIGGEVPLTAAAHDSNGKTDRHGFVVRVAKSAAAEASASPPSSSRPACRIEVPSIVVEEGVPTAVAIEAGPPGVRVSCRGVDGVTFEQLDATTWRVTAGQRTEPLDCTVEWTATKDGCQDATVTARLHVHADDDPPHVVGVPAVAFDAKAGKLRFTVTLGDVDDAPPATVQWRLDGAVFATGQPDAGGAFVAEGEPTKAGKHVFALHADGREIGPVAFDVPKDALDALAKAKRAAAQLAAMQGKLALVDGVAMSAAPSEKEVLAALEDALSLRKETKGSGDPLQEEVHLRVTLAQALLLAHLSRIYEGQAGARAWNFLDRATGVFDEAAKLETDVGDPRIGTSLRAFALSKVCACTRILVNTPGASREACKRLRNVGERAYRMLESDFPTATSARGSTFLAEVKAGG